MPTAANPPSRLPASADSKRVVIGIQSPLSGAQAALGTGLRNGASLAAIQIARPLIDLGFSVELQALDDQDQPELAVANASALVGDADVLCTVGHFDSRATAAALEVYQKAALPLVIPASAGIGLTSSRFDNVVRLIGRDDVQASVGARFADERLKAEQAYILYEASDYGEILGSAFKRQAEASGIRVVAMQVLGSESPLEDIKTAKPDVIYLAARYPAAGPLIGQLRSNGVEAVLIGPDGIDSPELLRLAGAPVENLYYTVLTAPIGQLPYAAQFAADYEARYASTAPPFAAQAFDAASICIEAIARAADQAGGRPTREQVRSALRELRNYEGIAGSYRFTQRGELAQAPYYIVQAGPTWGSNVVVADVMAAAPR